MKKTRLQILEQTYELIKDSNNWIRGFDALDRFGYIISPDHPWASQWCLAGAINKVAENNYASEGLFPNELLRTLNDASNHRDVLNFLQMHINSEKRKSQ